MGEDQEGSVEERDDICVDVVMGCRRVVSLLGG